MATQIYQRRVWLLEAIKQEREWIRTCENNPASSYYGPNAEAVKKADQDALARYESEYRQLGGVFLEESWERPGFGSGPAL